MSNNNIYYSTDDEEELNIKKAPKKKIKPIKLFADSYNNNDINNNYINNINNYDINNNYINNNNNNDINNNNKNNKNIEDNELEKFLGLFEDDIKYKNKIKPTNWKYCDYCEKKHGSEYFFKNSNYCVLCWGWLNAAELELETGEYFGNIDYEEVKAMLVKTYPLYIKSNYNTPNSIYHKITVYQEAGILHSNFKKILGFEVEKTKPIEYLINNKERKLNINYEKTVLHI
jgi:hypothetical protein